MHARVRARFQACDRPVSRIRLSFASDALASFSGMPPTITFDAAAPSGPNGVRNSFR